MGKQIMYWADAYEVNNQYHQVANSLKEMCNNVVCNVPPEHQANVTNFCSKVMHRIILIEQDRAAYVQPELDKHTHVSMVTAESYQEFLNTINYLGSYCSKLKIMFDELQKFVGSLSNGQQ
jgi:hypothetical protein